MVFGTHNHGFGCPFRYRDAANTRGRLMTSRDTRSNVSKSVLVAILLVLSAASTGNSVVAEGTEACGSDVLKDPMSCGRVATAQKPAILQVPADAKAAALEVTARPVAGENVPYLVGVFVGDPSKSNAKLLGSFSFFPARIGESQTFVLPKPAGADKNMTLSVKLIPANPERDIKDAAVEILGARLVRE
jgi:hypothetical protein